MRGGFLRNHRVSIASVTVVLIAAASLVVYALAAQGYSVHRAPLNDGGVWVSGANFGEFARLNKPVGQFDGGLWLGSQTDDQVGNDLDIVQDGAAVYGVNHTTARLAALDGAAMGVSPGQIAQIPPGAQVAAGGTSPASLAVLDPASGKLWATSIDVDQQSTNVTPLDHTAKPLATVGPSAALAVSQGGTIFAVSAAGELRTIRPTPTGFARPTVADLGRLTGAPSITTVGERPVVLSGNTVFWDGRTARLGDAAGSSGAVLQQPGPGAADVLVATPRGLRSVDLGSGRVSEVSGPGTGTVPVAPVRNGDCVYAAWSGVTASYRTSCGQSTYSGSVAAGPGDPLRFRVNRAQVVLNDTRSGAVWNVDSSQAVQVDDWDAIIPPKATSGKQQHDPKSIGTQSKPPNAKPDVLYARPGRTTVLHVLDNDTRPPNDVIAITGRPTGLSNPDATLAVSADEQTVAITLPATVTSAVHFTYSITDVHHPQPVSAPVTVKPVPDGVDTAPFLCTCAQDTDWAVGVSSVLDIPVAGNWRDKEGDPVTLVSSDAGSVQTSVTSDGDILFTAPDTPPPGGKVAVKYVATDGYGKTSPGSLTVRVLGANATKGVPPIAQTDVAQTTVGQTVTLHPLANDLPGADPTTDDPALRLGDVAQQPGAVITTDPQHGLVTFTAKTAKTFLLHYSVTYGIESASGVIRVDVLHATRSANDVVALPDTAVLYGQQTSTVDLLANDYDKQGGLLVVQGAHATDPDSGLRMSVVQGRFLHIALGQEGRSVRPEDVTYTVTDGSDTATGHVSVIELPGDRPDVPVALPDTADVRAGDSVLVPVLDNDLDPAGSPLSLVVGSVTAPRGGGSTFQTGNSVRYLPPPGVPRTTTATFTYVVTNGEHSTTGAVTVTIHPLPATPADDQPPAPMPIEQSVVAGGTVTIRIPTSGVDPDGDSVTFDGIDSPAPSLGTITSTTATTLVYQAFPAQDNVGTDAIGYRVVDPFGRVGESIIRIAVVGPGQIQPPIAVADVAQGAPGAKLGINVVANDVISPGDLATVSIAHSSAADARIDSSNPDVLDVTAPQPGPPLTIDYLLSDGTGAPAPGTLTVTGVTGWDNPPVAQDDYARPSKPGASTTSVDVLANDYDADRADRIRIVKVFRAGSTFAGKSVTIRLTDAPQVVPYEISDGAKTAVGIVFVPPVGTGAAYLKKGAFISVPEDGSTKQLDINDYLVDPAGKKLITTFVQNQSAAPSGSVQIGKLTGAEIVLTGAAHYVGPGSITLQVTNGATPTSKGATTGYVTIPVQVGHPTPVLRCPVGDVREIYQGGSPDSINVAAVCHLWLPQDTTLSQVKLTSSWTKQPDGVRQSIDNSAHLLTVTPSRNARPGETGSLRLGISGSAQHQLIGYRVSALPKLQLTPITAAGQNNKAVTVHVAPHASTPILDPKFEVTRCQRTGGMQASCTADGSDVVITPADTARGTITFAVTLTDVPGDASRQITGAITVDVIGRPAPPSAVRAEANRTDGGTVRLSWTDPAFSGGPNADYIDHYQVRYAGGSHRCAASGCLISGLTDGKAYVFSVTTVNKAGKPSSTAARSNTATPDTKPNQVGGLAARLADGRITLTWVPPARKGSAVRGYDVQYTDIGTHAPGDQGVHAVTGLSFPASVTNDDPYRFKVRARNGDGAGPWSATYTAQSAGTPATVTGVTAPPESSTSPSKQVYVTVTWDKGSDPNGGPLAYYTVYRSATGGAAKVICAQVSAGESTPSCTDSVTNDGTQYAYTVTATNSSTPSGAQHESRPSAPASFDATGVPDQVSGVAAFASQAAFTSGTPDPGPAGGSGAGFDRGLRVRFTVPQPNGGSVVGIDYALNGGAFQPLAVSGALTPGARVSGTISDLTNGQGYTVSLRARNSKNAGPASAPTAAEYPYGTPNVPTVSAAANGTSVNYQWSGSPNGRTIEYLVAIDGGGFLDKGNTPGSQTNTRGYSYTYSIQAYVTDTAGQASAKSALKSGTTPDVPAPANLDCSGNGQSISCTWKKPASGLTFRYRWDGGGWTSTSGTSTSKSFGYSEKHTLGVQSTDGTHYSSVANASATTGAKPPPARSVSLKKGASSGYNSNCPSNCFYFDFTVQGFSPGSYTYQCGNSVHVFDTGTLRITSSNQEFASGYCYSQSNYRMPQYMTVDGVRSNNSSW